MKLFKFFYNPFKPHIAQLRDGDFAVRKLNILGWEYLDSWGDVLIEYSDFWWRRENNILKYTTHQTKELALERLEYHRKCKEAKKEKFSKRVV
jgi:hypothetical protein